MALMRSFKMTSHSVGGLEFKSSENCRFMIFKFNFKIFPDGLSEFTHTNASTPATITAFSTTTVFASATAAAAAAATTTTTPSHVITNEPPSSLANERQPQFPHESTNDGGTSTTTAPATKFLRPLTHELVVRDAPSTSEEWYSRGGWT